MRAVDCDLQISFRFHGVDGDGRCGRRGEDAFIFDPITLRQFEDQLLLRRARGAVGV